MKCQELTAGKLRTLIEIQEEGYTRDAGGGRIKTWTTVLRALSYWKTAYGFREQMHAGTLAASKFHKVYFRYSSVVTAKHRLICEGVVYQIRGVDDLEKRKQWTELVIEEGAPT